MREPSRCGAFGAGDCPAICSGDGLCDAGRLSDLALAAGRPHSVAVCVDGHSSRALVTLPLSVYTLWVTQADPVLRGWTAQNVTPSPPVWDYALGYGLILALAVPGHCCGRTATKRY